jgi:hypothetical protein
LEFSPSLKKRTGCLFNGIARIVEGVAGKQHSGFSKAFLIGVGILAIIISILVMAFPLLFGAALAGIIIAIGLLITGIQMVTSGIAGRIRGVSAPQDEISR